MPVLPGKLEATLCRLAECAERCRDPWWVIGSAALALHGVAGLVIADVDVIASERDTLMLIERHGEILSRNGGDDRFRSALFGRIGGSPLPIEIMAGLSVRSRDGWSAVQPATRVGADLATGRVHMPDRMEMTSILRRFGRPKDLQRLALLERN